MAGNIPIRSYGVATNKLELEEEYFMSTRLLMLEYIEQVTPRNDE